MSVAALVAAAGTSVRMGFPKALLARPDNTLLLVRHVEVLRAGGVDPVLVTLPPPDVLMDRPRIQAILDTSGATVMENRFMERGLLGSVQSALERVDADACLLLPVDTPGVTGVLVDAVLAEGARRPGRFVRPAVGALTGHPLLIPRRAYAQIRAFQGAGGVRALLEDVVDMPWPHACVCQAMNTPETAASQQPALARWRP